MKFDLKWEQLMTGDFTTHRLCVPGGWIVKVIETSYVTPHPASGRSQEEQFSVALTFVPDPNHEWEV